MWRRHRRGCYGTSVLWRNEASTPDVDSVRTVRVLMCLFIKAVYFYHPVPWLILLLIYLTINLCVSARACSQMVVIELQMLVVVKLNLHVNDVVIYF